MNIPRFRITKEQAKLAEIALDPKESRHAGSVMRLERGDAVELFDGEGRVWAAVVLNATKAGVTVTRGLEREAAAGPACEVTLGVCLVKSEAMDLIVEKACELGVSAIAPLVSERTVVRLDESKRAAKVERWKRIASESAKQCGRAVLPAIEPVRRFQDFVAGAQGYDMILLPTLAVPGPVLGAPILKAAKRVLVLIGPEGDFTPDEAALALKAGATAVSLGPLVLRSETAAMHVLSSLNFHYGGTR